MKLDYKSNITTTIKSTKAIRPMLARAKRPAVRAWLDYFRKRAFSWILSGGRGSWPKFHPLTQKFRYDPQAKRWRRRGSILGRRHWGWLTKFLVDWINRYATFAKVEFGRPWRTNASQNIRQMAERALWMATGHKTTLKPEQYRLFGATRRKSSDKPGEDFFPLQASTKSVVIERHSIMTPVFREVEPRTLAVYGNAYVKALKKQENKLP